MGMLDLLRGYSQITPSAFALNPDNWSPEFFASMLPMPPSTASSNPFGAEIAAGSGPFPPPIAGAVFPPVGATVGAAGFSPVYGPTPFDPSSGSTVGGPLFAGSASRPGLGSAFAGLIAADNLFDQGTSTSAMASSDEPVSSPVINAEHFPLFWGDPDALKRYLSSDGTATPGSTDTSDPQLPSTTTDSPPAFPPAALFADPAQASNTELAQAVIPYVPPLPGAYAPGGARDAYGTTAADRALGNAIGKLFDPRPLAGTLGNILFDEAAPTDPTDRAGKDFTRKGKAQIDRDNAEKNGGVNVCEQCGVEVKPGEQSTKGVTPPDDERQRDHKVPKAKGGPGVPENGQILCRACNLEKGDN